MNTNLSPTLIVAIPGTQETQELSRASVIVGIRLGQIRMDQWVWSPSDNDWKQVAEIPELHQPQAASPAPSEVFRNGVVPRVTIKTPTVVNQVSVSPRVQPARAQVIRAGQVTGSAQAAAPTRYSRPMENKEEFPIFKILFLILFLALASVLAVNYFLVEQPFATNLATTSFANTPAYAHLGGFVQTDALVIHIPPSTSINSDNFADYLAVLAGSTPSQPFNSLPFTGVGLTSSWKSQYCMNGADWATLGKMTNASSSDKKKFELEHLLRIDGSPLVRTHRHEDPAAITEAEDKAWPSLVANFQAKAQ